MPSVSLIIVCQLGGNVAAATELASSTKAVASCQERVETKTWHLHEAPVMTHGNQDDGGDYDDLYQDSQEREAEPSFPEMTVTWVTSANVVVC